jgi:hypothetical protein
VGWGEGCRKTCIRESSVHLLVLIIEITDLFISYYKNGINIAFFFSKKCQCFVTQVQLCKENMLTSLDLRVN